MADFRTFTARWVFPVAGAPLPNGTVTVQGSVIAAVDAHGVRTADEDLGNVAIIPGLVNAHTHLDLSGARNQIPPTPADQFTDWLRGVIAFRRSRTPEQVKADIRHGLAECLEAGTTLIGDIASDGSSWDALSTAQTRAVVFHEVLGLSSQRFQHSAAAAVRWVGNGHHETATCSPGISPHAPYSCCADRLPHLTAALPLLGNRLTVHLAETRAELELLNKFSGPFVEFLTELGVWDPSGLALGVEQVLDSTRGAKHALYAHCNYLPPETAFGRNQSVVYCPRTHAAFGHSPHPFRQFLDRRVRVCLGTDSLASTPDLDILAEARFLAARFPDFPGEQLLRMATISGAEALGWSDETGSLEIGKSADLVVVPLPSWKTAEPYELLFADYPEKRRTMFRGEWRD